MPKADLPDVAYNKARLRGLFRLARNGVHFARNFEIYLALIRWAININLK